MFYAITSLHESPSVSIPAHLTVVRITDFDFGAVKKEY